jgi:hypothetical protein
MHRGENYRPLHLVEVVDGRSKMIDLHRFVQSEQTLNPIDGKKDQTMRKQIGAHLNRRWSIGAKHALYHKDGTWYHQLKYFPGVLCDPFGYVLFPTAAAFRSCARLRIDQDVNVSGHISEIPGYVRVPESEIYRE